MGVEGDAGHREVTGRRENSRAVGSSQATCAAGGTEAVSAGENPAPPTITLKN